VPSFRRRASVLDAEPVEKAQEEPDRAAGVAEAKALAEEAEAEAAEAEAMAAAARARAKAIRLRKQAEAADESDNAKVLKNEATDTETETESDTEADAEVETESGAPAEQDVDPDAGALLDEDTSEDEEDEEDVAVEATTQEPPRARRRWLPRLKWKYIAAGVALLCTGALLAASGYMVWQHREAVALQQRSAEFAAAGRQSVVTLMSLDFNNAQADVQRIIDNSTGQFKDDFQNTAEDFVKVAQESKVVTEVTVNSVAVESMTDDSAVVLVAAASRVTNSAGANQEPRTWRLSVNLQREGDQIKMSKVEFVP
jgi:Mce-associated membrane protein